MPASNAAPFLAARDFLLRHREDYATAYRDFRWPKLDRFNWALDYFDVMARDNAQVALWLVDEGAGETKLTFAELSERSNRVANAFRRLGVQRGDRVLLMLGNVVALWESMLAAMKLGAVVVPATTLLTRNDLADRFARGHVKHVIASADAAVKFADLPGDYTRIVVGNAVPGWVSYEGCYAASPDFTPAGETHADDPLLLYFTSGTTADAEARPAQSSKLSGRPSFHGLLAWIAPRRRASQHFIPGLGEARVELFLFAVDRTGDDLHRQSNPLQRARSSRHDRALRRHYVLRSAHGLAHVDPGGSRRLAGQTEGGDRRR